MGHSLPFQNHLHFKWLDSLRRLGCLLITMIYDHGQSRLWLVVRGVMVHYRTQYFRVFWRSYSLGSALHYVVKASFLEHLYNSRNWLLLHVIGHLRWGFVPCSISRAEILLLLIKIPFSLIIGSLILLTTSLKACRGILTLHYLLLSVHFKFAVLNT